MLSPSPAVEALNMISHHHWKARELQHFKVIEVVAQRHNFTRGNSTLSGPEFQSLPLEHPSFMMSKMAILRSGYFVQVRWMDGATSRLPKQRFGRLDARRRSADHDLHGVGFHRCLQLRDEQQVIQMVLRYQPSGPSGIAQSSMVTCPRPGGQK